MKMNEAETLARHSRGAMIAAAGCGKTEVIATAVARHGGQRELILTHTHAGVDAIRRRLRKLGAPSAGHHVDTIAGWTLRLANAFPKTSALVNPQPRSNSDYSAVYAAAARLLGNRPVKEIVRASYSGVYVDEYQDCSVHQHDCVLGLASFLPCRIVGDPLQAIFNFGENGLIDWDNHIKPSFDPLNGPATPWRWANSNAELGDWLKEVRTTLEGNGVIDLSRAPLQWMTASNPRLRQNQLQACLRLARAQNQTVIVICQWPNQCHAFASCLSGVFSCIEAMDTDALYNFAESVEQSRGLARAVELLNAVGKCMTKVKTELKSICTAFSRGRVPTIRKHKECLAALLAVAETDSMAPVEPALETLARVPGAIVYRRELFREMTKAVRARLSGEADTLLDAAWLVRNRTRHGGRVLPRCGVGTTLLVKGLEFDHAVVLDADAHDARNLYVALTRGSRSLTIFSRSRALRPAASPRRR